MSEVANTKSISLTDDERTMLVFGLKDWGGPAHGTDALAMAMGFESLEDLQDHGDRIAETIAAGGPHSRRDWTRALLATEVAFASDIVGTGSEWTSIQGGRDEDWIRVLRKLQVLVPWGRRFIPE